MSDQPSSTDQNKPASPSELFTVRVWREVLDDHFEWRGKVQHTGSHKESYFCGWEALITFIKQILSDENGKSEFPHP